MHTSANTGILGHEGSSSSLARACISVHPFESDSVEPSGVSRGVKQIVETDINCSKKASDGQTHLCKENEVIIFILDLSLGGELSGTLMVNKASNCASIRQSPSFKTSSPGSPSSLLPVGGASFSVSKLPGFNRSSDTCCFCTWTSWAAFVGGYFVAIFLSSIIAARQLISATEAANVAVRVELLVWLTRASSALCRAFRTAGSCNWIIFLTMLAGVWCIYITLILNAGLSQGVGCLSYAGKGHARALQDSNANPKSNTTILKTRNLPRLAIDNPIRAPQPEQTLPTSTAAPRSFAWMLNLRPGVPRRGHAPTLARRLPRDLHFPGPVSLCALCPCCALRPRHPSLYIIHPPSRRLPLHIPLLPSTFSFSLRAHLSLSYHSYTAPPSLTSHLSPKRKAKHEPTTQPSRSRKPSSSEATPSTCTASPVGYGDAGGDPPSAWSRRVRGGGVWQLRLRVGWRPTRRQRGKGKAIGSGWKDKGRGRAVNTDRNDDGPARMRSAGRTGASGVHSLLYGDADTHAHDAQAQLHVRTDAMGADAGAPYDAYAYDAWYDAQLHGRPYEVLVAESAAYAALALHPTQVTSAHLALPTITSARSSTDRADVEVDSSSEGATPYRLWLRDPTSAQGSPSRTRTPPARNAHAHSVARALSDPYPRTRAPHLYTSAPIPVHKQYTPRMVSASGAAPHISRTPTASTSASTLYTGVALCVRVSSPSRSTEGAYSCTMLATLYFAAVVSSGAKLLYTIKKTLRHWRSTWFSTIACVCSFGTRLLLNGTAAERVHSRYTEVEL
ncbi:hypothetical protein B0H19DRAFT_1226935 [Mycena capillaripes]|nr:hypothetical protein B0H19DRAFT_1226935 [Mycena capillaripes]